MVGRYEETLERLTAYRKDRNITQMDMENWFGITQSHYSKMELGRSEIPYDFLYKLYECEWDIDYLVTGVSRQRPNRELRLLVQLYSGKKQLGMIKLLVWAADQFAARSGKEAIRQDIRALNLLLADEPVVSIMYLVRNVKEFSQVNMAEYLGIGMKKYRKIEKGYLQPDLEILTTVYELSGCRPSLFLNGQNGMMILLESVWKQIDPMLQIELLHFLQEGSRLMDVGRELIENM